MSEVARGAGGTDPDQVDPDPDAAPPLAAERPYVDGSDASPEELRAEVERLSNEERQHVDDLREEVGDSLAELASRFDVKARMTEKRDDAVATVQQRVEQARSTATEGAAAATDAARQRPAVVAAAVAALLALLVAVVRRRRR